MNDANHIGDLNEMVVGDNDHGDALPEPKCGSCGVPWIDHMGIMGACADNAALREDLKHSLEAHDEMRLEIVRLTKERNEARRMYCEAGIITGQKCEVQAHYISTSLGWDCYDKKKETP